MTKKEIEVWLANNEWTLENGTWCDKHNVVEIEIVRSELMISALTIKVVKPMKEFIASQTTKKNHKYNFLSGNGVIIYGKDIQ